MEHSKTVMPNDCLEKYERLKSNIIMYFNEVDSLITEDTGFLIQLNNLKERYFSNII